VAPADQVGVCVAGIVSRFAKRVLKSHFWDKIARLFAIRDRPDTFTVDGMKYRHKSLPSLIALLVACFVEPLGRLAIAEDIIDDWANVQVPPPPEVKKVTVDPTTAALLVMGFVVESCNIQRRPRGAATIPQVKTLLVEARAHGVLSCTAFQPIIPPETSS
jgi:hypothetical protein